MLCNTVCKRVGVAPEDQLCSALRVLGAHLAKDPHDQSPLHRTLASSLNQMEGPAFTSTVLYLPCTSILRSSMVSKLILNCAQF
jgi:hypothetical protein